MSEKGQGALEYLLLISGEVIVVVIVICILLSMGNPQTEKEILHSGQEMKET